MPDLPDPDDAYRSPSAGPAWGTPPAAERPARKTPWPPPEPVAAHGVHGFRHVVEQVMGGSGDFRWGANELDVTYPTREAAREAAPDVCRRFHPGHPFSEQGRQVRRVSADEYLVLVQGRTALFHFRLTVVELLD